MNWFDSLKNAALDFIKTPFAQQLAFGTASPTTGTQPAQPATLPNTAANSGLPSWVMPAAIGGGILVLVLLVWSMVRGK